MSIDSPRPTAASPAAPIPNPSTLPDAAEPSPAALSQRLKAATQAAHGALDQRIMAFQPFADRARYAAFLQVQFRFHRDVAALFQDPALDRLLPGLKERQRLAAVTLDLQDLGQAVPADLAPPVFPSAEGHDLATALGWLYVEEGSNLGAAFLYKMAARLGLDAACGARHLAPLPGGRALSWKEFVAQLDAVPLAPASIERAEAAAQAAFGRVLAHVEAHCPLPATAA